MDLCLLLAIEGLMAMMESPHFRTTFASLKKFLMGINFSWISAKATIWAQKNVTFLLLSNIVLVEVVLGK